MKQLRHYWNKSREWLLSTLLTVLGFSACDDPGDDPIVYMYGTLQPSFCMKGKVVNPANAALPGIRVVIVQAEGRQAGIPDSIPGNPVIAIPIHDTLYTNKDGQFIRWSSTLPLDTIRYEFQFYDVDTTASSPHYQADTLKVEFLAEELVYPGNSHSKTNTVVLKEEKDEQ